MRLFRACALAVFLLSSCAGRESAGEYSGADNEAETETEQASVIDPIRTMAEAVVSLLDDRLLSAQVLVCGIDGRGSLPTHMKTLLTGCPAGGVMLFKYNLDTDNDSICALIGETSSLIQKESGLSPFVSVDHEGGSINRFMPGVASLPAAASYWDLFLVEGGQAALSKIEADSFKAGRELSGMGINLNFAPVAEYLNDDNRGFLYSRSYGRDPSFTAGAADAFIRGMERAGVLCVVKHFPGSAGRDPHYSASVINLDKPALDVLVFPFAVLFSNGARAVMAAHTAVPAVDDKIASLSPVVMQDWLRGGMGFDGMIIADDFSMAAAGGISAEEAAVASIAAGADMVLVWQPDIARTHRALLSALEDGRLPRERLERAARRIVYEKIRSGLINGNNT
jgi:beta-N-acetylhexosaminidase